MKRPAFELEICPTRLSPAQIERFERDGFIAFADVLSPAEVEAAKAALLDIVESLRPDHRTFKNQYGQVWAPPIGRLKVQFQDGFEPDERAGDAVFDRVRKFSGFVDENETLAHLAHTQEKIQGVLRSLFGADPLLTQDMALVNPPGVGTGKPWHQDDAYFSVVPLDAVVGVWIALDEARADNGCMNFLPGWHKKGALRHFHGVDCEIVPERVANVEHVPVPLSPGGAVFFNGIAPHMTKANNSPLRRRALQFHYRAQSSRVVERPEYDQIFAESDGTPASCAAAAKRGF